MKIYFVYTVLMILVCRPVFASTVTTSSRSPNVLFPKSPLELVALDYRLVRGFDLFAQRVGPLRSYTCTASDTQTLSCAFRHDLPRDWDWFGCFELTYATDRDGSTSFTQNWLADCP